MWSGVCSFWYIALTEPCHRLTRDIRPVRSGEMERCPVTYKLLSVNRIIGNSTETSELDSSKHSLSLKLVLRYRVMGHAVIERAVLDY